MRDLVMSRFIPSGQPASQYPGTASVILSTSSMMAVRSLGDRSISDFGLSVRIRFEQAVQPAETVVIRPVSIVVTIMEKYE